MKKRILFLHEAFPAGGAERITLDIARYISEYDYQTFVCSRLQNDFRGDELQLIPLPDTTCTVSSNNIDFLVETIQRLNIDIFVLPVQAFVGLCEKIKEHTDCKLVFALHSIPFWEVTYRLYEKKKEAHGSIGKQLEWYLLTYPKTMWLKKYHKTFVEIYSRIYQLADAYVVLCDKYKELFMQELHIRPEEDKITVIHNSERMVENVSAEKKKQVLFVGRLTYEDKRIDKLLRIWNHIYRNATDWELVLVGDGPERMNLENYVIKKRLKRVRFVGFSNQVHRFYQDAAVICLTSTFEGWPLCLTEAQANGVVPVAFDCSAGIQEILFPSGVNGVLVPSYNERKFAQELLALLRDAERLKEMSLNVVRKSAFYNPNVVGKKWLNMFNLLLGKV